MNQYYRAYRTDNNKCSFYESFCLMFIRMKTYYDIQENKIYGLKYKIFQGKLYILKLETP